MTNWEIVRKVKDAVPPGEDGWRAMDVVWGFLDGDVTREEAKEALDGLVKDPTRLLEEVGA